MFGFGIWEVILVLALIVLFFGGRKIPELARGLGSAIRNFKGEIGSGDEGEPEGRELPGSGDDGSAGREANEGRVGERGAGGHRAGDPGDS